MNWSGWLLWGFVATVVLTTLMAGSQGMRLTRMNLPYMLGTMFTASRDRAKAIGFALHLVNGWIFALIYVAAFNSWGRATWWLGGALANGGFPRFIPQGFGADFQHKLESVIEREISRFAKAAERSRRKKQS